MSVFGKSLFKITDTHERYIGESKVEYKPHITTSKFNSIGTTSVITDWKTGRGVHCLSQGEALWYYILRRDDENINIQEQFPLNMKKINTIFEQLGISKIKNPKFIMTTDFLVTKRNGSKIACSVKNDRKLNRRTLELLTAEKTYWITQNIQYKLLFKEDVNQILSDNIRLIVEFYNPERVVDDVSKAKHLLATKKVHADLSSRALDVGYLKKLGLIE